MPDIESLLKEKRVFKPSPEFRKRANWNKKTIKKYRKLGARDPPDPCESGFPASIQPNVGCHCDRLIRATISRARWTMPRSKRPIAR